MDHVLVGIPFFRLYVDDVVIFSKTVDDHLVHIEEVLTRIAKHSLKIKMSKCFFVQKEVELLGHVVSKGGVKVDPKKVSAIQYVKAPSRVKGVRRFLGMAGYYRRFVFGFAEIAVTLHEET